MDAVNTSLSPTTIAFTSGVGDAAKYGFLRMRSEVDLNYDKSGTFSQGVLNFRT